MICLMLDKHNPETQSESKNRANDEDFPYWLARAGKAMPFNLSTSAFFISDSPL